MHVFMYVTEFYPINLGGNDNTGDEDVKASSKSKSKQKRRRPGYVINFVWPSAPGHIYLF